MNDIFDADRLGTVTPYTSLTADVGLALPRLSDTLHIGRASEMRSNINPITFYGIEDVEQ